MHDLRLLTASAGLALLASSAGGMTAQAADQLTVVSWGGAYGMSQIEAYHKPFSKENGVEILSEDYNGGLAQIRAQVESGNVTWDLVDLETVGRRARLRRWPARGARSVAAAAGARRHPG
jgi:putative spermidine/putrescine transport system substrate-binding protein